MFGSTEIPDLIDDNNFTYKKRNYLISDITALDFTRQSTTSSFVFIPVHTSDYLDFTIYFINNEELRINQSIKGKNKVFLEFFKFIQEHSYKNRILKYITALEKDKYFVYNNVKFYENGNVEMLSTNKKFNINDKEVRFQYEPFNFTITPKQGFFEGIFSSKSINIEIKKDMDCFFTILSELYSLDLNKLLSQS